ncbi:MAG: hypothetical protein ACYDCK_12140 [Thermoplasmatota archaeon]
MGSEPRVLRVGKLIAEGVDLRFEPESDGDLVFPIVPGEAMEVGLRYAYAEESDEKEEFRVRFSVDLEGKRLGDAEHTIKDRPLLNDDEWGFLTVPGVAPASGPVRVGFLIDARYSIGPWTSGAKLREVARLQHRGEFVLDVREDAE